MYKEMRKLTVNEILGRDGYGCGPRVFSTKGN